MDNKNPPGARTPMSSPKSPAAHGKPAIQNSASRPNGNKAMATSTPHDETELDDTPKVENGFSSNLNKIISVIVATGLVISASVFVTIYIEDWTRQSDGMRTIDAALSNYITAHRSDAKTVPEIALVDTIRQCIASVVQQPVIRDQSSMNQIVAKAISDAEKSCIDKDINAAIKDLFFATEVLSRDDKNEDSRNSVKSAFHHVMFIITFARSKSYSLPGEYANLKYDPNMLWAYYEDLTNLREKQQAAGSSWQY